VLPGSPFDFAQGRLSAAVGMTDGAVASERTKSRSLDYARDDSGAAARAIVKRREKQAKRDFSLRKPTLRRSEAGEKRRPAPFEMTGDGAGLCRS
jgi:hypothetical protein